MKKSIKIILSIIIILAIAIWLLYYLLIPNERTSQNSDNKIITTEELFQNSSINEFELVKNPLKLKGKISVSDNEFQNIIYTAMNKNNVEELKDANVNIHNNKIRITYPYKILGFIDSQLEVNLVPRVSENKLNILVTEAKLGKINISDKILKEGLKSYKDKIPFEVDNNTIIIDKSYTYPTTINNIKINEKDIVIDLEIQADNIIDFISKYKINVK